MDDQSKTPHENHGWVFPLPDGAVARCGGPALCRQCAEDAANVKRLTILPDSEPILSEVMPPFRGNPKNLRLLAHGMYLAMSVPRDVTTDSGMERITGVGLAACQVGVRTRMFVMQPPKTGGFRDCIVAINPIITMSSPEKGEASEMCLSSPGQCVVVRRLKEIMAEWTDLDGRRCRAHMQGMAARIFQHEFDHLNGVRIIDYAVKPALCDDGAASPAASVAPN